MDERTLEQSLVRFLQQNPEFYSLVKDKKQLMVVEALEEKPIDFGRLRFKLSSISIKEVQEIASMLLEKKLVSLAENKGRQFYSLPEKTIDFLKKFRAAKGKLTF